MRRVKSRPTGALTPARVIVERADASGGSILADTKIKGPGRAAPGGA